MPSSHRPANPGKPDAVDAWVALMKKWDAAYKNYLAARNTRAASEAKDGAPYPGLKDEEDQALAALAKIKAEMDRVVAETRQRREPIGDTIVIGTIGPGDGEPEDPDKAKDDSA